jgi:S-DNA-T family DNA segregation ATPase FtsK/SpoIIIE
MDMLVTGPGSEEIAKPDNAARAALIVETLSSFGVEARVVQINEGPTETQFGNEPGWDIKYRQVAEKDREGKPV